MPFTGQVQTYESVVSNMITSCELGDALFDATDDSARSCICMLTLASNLDSMVREEAVPDSTDASEFDQRVLELSEAQLSFVIGDLVQAYHIALCELHFRQENERDFLWWLQVSSVVLFSVVIMGRKGGYCHTRHVN